VPLFAENVGPVAAHMRRGLEPMSENLREERLNIPGILRVGYENEGVISYGGGL